MRLTFAADAPVESPADAPADALVPFGMAPGPSPLESDAARTMASSAGVAFMGLAVLFLY